MTKTRSCDGSSSQMLEDRSARMEAVAGLRAKRPKPINFPVVPQIEPSLIDGEFTLQNRQLKKVTIQYTALSNTSDVEVNTASNVDRLRPSEWTKEHKAQTKRIVVFADTVDLYSGSTLSDDFKTETAPLQEESEKDVEDLLEERKEKLNEKKLRYSEGIQKHEEIEKHLSELYEWQKYGEDPVVEDAEEELEEVESYTIADEISETEQFKEKLELALRVVRKSIKYDQNWVRQLQNRYDAQFKIKSWLPEEKELHPHFLETRKGLHSQIEIYKKIILKKIDTYEKLEQAKQAFDCLFEKHHGNPKILQSVAPKQIESIKQMLRIETVTVDDELLEQIKIGFESDLRELGNEIRIIHNKRVELKDRLAEFV